MSSELQLQCLELAFQQAVLSQAVGEVPVGAVFVIPASVISDESLKKRLKPVSTVAASEDNDSLLVLASAHNLTNLEQNGSRHCEIICVDHVMQLCRDVCDDDSTGSSSSSTNSNSLALFLLSNSELYVTVEPCIMCAAALRYVGVRRVVFGCFNERFGGCGGVLRIHDIETCGPAEGGHSCVTVTKSNNRSESDSLGIGISNLGKLNVEQITSVEHQERAVRLLKEFYERGNPNAPEEKRKRPLVS